ncbi:hypothetical protein T492DRAFT_835922 [Pavlovales sp. CCMP2436]|nr:hypothetical protein T492DRAFT_835922 [Pavlovales sp. CCMP2436]
MAKAPHGEEICVQIDLRTNPGKGTKGGDGYEATRIAKKELECTVPIVACSAEELVEAELFDGFQPKPLSVDALTMLLKKSSPPTRSSPSPPMPPRPPPKDAVLARRL